MAKESPSISVLEAAVVHLQILRLLQPQDLLLLDKPLHLLLLLLHNQLKAVELVPLAPGTTFVLPTLNVALVTATLEEENANRLGVGYTTLDRL